MIKQIDKKRAFTIIEIILVIAILLIVFGFVALYAQTSQVRADINTQADIAVSYLRLMQSNTASGRTLEGNAIHLETNAYTLFNGPSYVSEDINNYTIDLPATLNIENILLNGAGQDIIFSGPAGETLNYGNFDLVANQIGKTITINISELGTITY